MNVFIILFRDSDDNLNCVVSEEGGYFPHVKVFANFSEADKYVKNTFICNFEWAILDLTLYFPSTTKRSKTMKLSNDSVADLALSETITSFPALRMIPRETLTQICRFFLARYFFLQENNHG